VRRSVPECNTNGLAFSKRRRCRKCVTRGGQFHTQGAGYGLCKLQPPPPPPPPPPPAPEVLSSVGMCKAHVRSFGKRRHCYKCVRRGGRFHRSAGRGRGRCAF
jgi:hypothetical protein